ncbi:tRNA wybutosine-synthesizing protein 4 isoform X2 [Trichomycterus rosablanca]|uniref:tRNA wybutosine-synthesizing protein 4 isoform X2 n=1 Tax=Trichomycterus rosablanca TaxID=2290929 RepID=UPI002F35408C
MPVTKNKNPGKDTAVQGTNDSSVVSKVSAAAQGYFKDELLQHFVSKVSRRTALINRGYYVRWKAVDHCVKQFLCATNTCARRQILSLGAGFDSLYFRLHAEEALQNVIIFEVDFPDVARRKAALINGSNLLKATISDWDHLAQTGPAYVSSVHYKLLGVDLRKEKELEDVLHRAGLHWNCPTLVLSEVVLTYMETQWCVPTLDWEECVCMDMNQFFFSLLTDDERERVEKLEPFDEFEEWHQKCSHYFILTASNGSLTRQALLTLPSETPIPLIKLTLDQYSMSVQLMTESQCVEAVGMASSMLEPRLLLLTGGCGRQGRNSTAMLLMREHAGWRHAVIEPEGQKCVRLYHTMTSVPGGGAVILGGRTSPLNPIDSILKVTCSLRDKHNPKVLVSINEMVCTGPAPIPRWRHTATLLIFEDRNYLFVFGGRTERELVLGDSHFLSLEDQHWVNIPLEGCFPKPRHSHSACPYKGGLVMFGGLGKGGVPLGDIFLLKPTCIGFCWERLHVHPALVPRYSHTAHVIGENLVVVGGVWLQSAGVPGVAIINLISRNSVEISIDTSSVPWPLMLHSFCSELLDSEGTEVVLIGGGGSCFSFGTHFNAQPVTLDLSPMLCNKAPLDS